MASKSFSQLILKDHLEHTTVTRIRKAVIFFLIYKEHEISKKKTKIMFRNFYDAFRELF